MSNESVHIRDGDETVTSQAEFTRGAVKLAGVALVLHLVVSAVHSIPHVLIPIPQPDALVAATLLVVFVLPVVGYALLRRNKRVGVAVFTLSMAASLALGVVLHFVVPNPDNVGAVASEMWHLPFLATSVGVALTDAFGTAVGVLIWRSDPSAVPTSGRVDGAPAGLRPFARLTYWFSRRWFGEVPEPLTVTAHHGGILFGSGMFETALDNADSVDESLKALANVKVAMVVGCEFCVDIGSFEATKHGVTEEQLRAFPNYDESDAFSDLERLVIEYAAAVSETPVEVSDDLFDELHEEFDEAELVELTAAIAYENYRARFNHAFGIGAQGFADESCPLPEEPPKN